MSIYIKDFDLKNKFRGYENKNFSFLIKIIAEKKEYKKGDQILYKKTKRFICEYIKEHYKIRDVSPTQISRLEKPRKNICSKYAPVYLIAVYMILSEFDILEDLKSWSTEETNRTYSEFGLYRILEMVHKLGDRRPNCSLIALFDANLDVLDKKLLETIIELFSVSKKERSTRIKDNDIIRG